jgi:hypothetical protein
VAGLPACAQRSETGEAKPCVGLDTGDEANTLPRRGSDGEQLMERRTFLLGLMGGLAAATGLVSTGTTPAEASPPQSTRGAEGLEIADLNPEKLDGVTGGRDGSIGATTGDPPGAIIGAHAGTSHNLFWLRGSR